MSMQVTSSNPTTSAAAMSPGGSNASEKSTVGNLDVSFLNLLITELKSQDPTAPMDATQMVGQMVSLNQLDQLIGIRQLLQPAAPATSPGTTSAVATGEN